MSEALWISKTQLLVIPKVISQLHSACTSAEPEAKPRRSTLSAAEGKVRSPKVRNKSEPITEWQFKSALDGNVKNLKHKRWINNKKKGHNTNAASLITTLGIAYAPS